MVSKLLTRVATAVMAASLLAGSMPLRLVGAVDNETKVTDQSAYYSYVDSENGLTYYYTYDSDNEMTEPTTAKPAALAEAEAAGFTETETQYIKLAEDTKGYTENTSSTMPESSVVLPEYVTTDYRTKHEEKTEFDEDAPAYAIDGVNPGVTMTLNDFWTTTSQNQSDATQWGDLNSASTNVTDHYDRGINANEVLKFSKWNQTPSGSRNYPLAGLTANWTSDGANTGIVNRTLSGGYPTLAQGTAVNGLNGSLGYLFSTSNHAGKASNVVTSPDMFIYENNGHYVYNSDDHFASYSNGAMTLYNKGADLNHGGHTGGQFFPFNTADQLLDKSELVNATANAINHYFGMHMQATFYQREGGMVGDEPMIFEFSGDDDMWLYIDGVLILDLGGMHGKVSGKIDFSTGDIYLDGETEASTNIKAQFDAAEVRGNFNGETFADESEHTMDMFYLERGNYVSNLRMEMNLVTPTYSWGTRTKHTIKEHGSVQLTKTDSETGKTMSGVPFDLYQQTQTGWEFVSGPYNTDAEGMLTVNWLTPGDYAFKEVGTVPGYKPNDTYYTFRIQGGQTAPVEVEAENEPYLHKMQILKVAADDPTQTIQDAVFQLLAADQEKVLESELTTGPDGTVTTEKEYLPGTYYFQEVSPAPGYESDDTLHEVIVQSGQTASKVYQVKVTNEKTPGSVILTKKDADTGETLEGAVFELYAQGDDETPIGGQHTTDEDGKIQVDDLPVGYYYFKEVTPPTGYKIIGNGETELFAIEFNQQQALELTVENELITGEVVLTKKDSSSERTLRGAVFDLYDADTGDIIKSDLETDANGKIELELVPGNYYFVETVPPAGFSADLDEKITFRITADQTTAVERTVYNDPDITPLPLTGGPGTLAFLVASLALMTMAGGLWLSRKRRAAKEVR